jgi:hypothetical protein
LVFFMMCNVFLPSHVKGNFPCSCIACYAGAINKNGLRASVESLLIIKYPHALLPVCPGRKGRQVGSCHTRFYTA